MARAILRSSLNVMIVADIFILLSNRSASTDAERAKMPGRACEQQRLRPRESAPDHKPADAYGQRKTSIPPKTTTADKSNPAPRVSPIMPVDTILCQRAPKAA